MPIGEFFEHPHDAEIRFAHLEIIRPNGAPFRVRTPIRFIGRTAMTRASSIEYFDIEYFDKIVQRICGRFDKPSLDAIERPKDCSGYFERSLVCAQFIALIIEPVRELAEKASLEHPINSQGREALSTMSLLSEGVLLGYLWAKAEAELRLKPLAKATLRSKFGGSLGGRKSGESRRSKRAKTWEAHARELAHSIRKDNPSFSQDEVASNIIVSWKEGGFSSPGHKTLKDLISKMEKDGELPRRKVARK